MTTISITLGDLLRESAAAAPGLPAQHDPRCDCQDEYAPAGYHSAALGTFLPFDSLYQLAGQMACGPEGSRARVIQVESIRPGSEVTVVAGGCRYRLGVTQGDSWRLCKQPGCEDSEWGLPYCSRHLALLARAEVLRIGEEWARQVRDERKTADGTEQDVVDAALSTGIPGPRVVQVLAAAMNDDPELDCSMLDGDRTALKLTIAQDTARLETRAQAALAAERRRTAAARTAASAHP